MTPKSRTKNKPTSSSALKHVAHAALPTRWGKFTVHGFAGKGPQEEAVALVRGNLKGKPAPLVRVHSQCLPGDVLNSVHPNYRPQLHLSLTKTDQPPPAHPITVR